MKNIPNYMIDKKNKLNAYFIRKTLTQLCQVALIFYG
jgi:hypothetical protein